LEGEGWRLKARAKVLQGGSSWIENFVKSARNTKKFFPTKKEGWGVHCLFRGTSELVRGWMYAKLGADGAVREKKKPRSRSGKKFFFWSGARAMDCGESLRSASYGRKTATEECNGILSNDRR